MALVSGILAPVVFSERCEAATRYAAALACRFRCELTLLHVFVQPWAAYSSPEGYATPPPYDHTSTLEQLRERLNAFMADELERLPVRRVLEEGDPAQVIAQYAGSERCGMVVMPTRGYGTFRRFLLGSVTAKVLHDVLVPVITEPHLAAPNPKESPCFHKILCAIDLCPEGRGVLEWAARFAHEFGSEISVVHALPISATRLEGVYFDEYWRTGMAVRARQEIAALQDGLDVKGEILIQAGDVPGAVRSAAGITGADLVVAGHGCSHGLLGRLRTNSYGIVRESSCPVAVV